MSNMVVRTNVFALNAHRNMKNVGSEQGRAAARLSSGYRINTAADDAAGLAISETMRAQIRGLDQASRNAQDAQSLVQTTEGGMQEITNMLQRVRELTVQAANDTNVSVNRTQIAYEVMQLFTEIQAMQSRVEFNTRTVLSMTGDSAKLHFQIGANANQSLEHDFSSISVAISNAFSVVSMVAKALGGDPEAALHGMGHTVDIDTVSTAAQISSLISVVQAELDAISVERAQLGAIVNRLDYTMRSLDISSENLSESESRIRNADMAREMMRFTMANVLQQASVSMLSQANQVPNNLLQLLR